MSDELSLINTLVAAVEQADEAIEQAKADLKVAHSHLHEHFAELGRRLVTTGEPQLPLKLARYLYWEVPRIHVASIGLALGVPTSEVHKLVGGSYKLACSTCETEFTIEGRTSRTSPSRQTQHTLCADCIRQRDARQATEHQEWLEQRKVEDARRAARIRQGDYWIDSYGDVVLPEGPWGKCGACTEPLWRIDDPAAWESGEGVVFRCRDHADYPYVPTLVTYVPFVSGGTS